MVDYHINLAREMVSTTEQRKRFYRGMLIYLTVCALVLAGAAWFSARNVKEAFRNRRECEHLLANASMVEGVDAEAFSNPDQIYEELQFRATEIARLKQALERQVRLLPVIHNLFAELPEGVALQSLSADQGKMAFGLLMPPSGKVADPVRDLKNLWKKNEALLTRVSSIRPVTGERRMVGTNSIFFVQFECFLNGKG